MSETRVTKAAVEVAESAGREKRGSSLYGGKMEIKLWERPKWWVVEFLRRS